MASPDATFRLVARQTLEGLGFEALECDQPARARDVLESKGPVLALFDAALPGSQELCAHLRGDRRSEPRCPFLVIVPFDRPDLVSRAFELGASDALLKPVHPLVLAQRVRTLVSLRTSRLALARERRQTDLLRRLAGCATWEWAPGSERLHVSPEASALLGLVGSRGGLALGDLLERVHPTDRPRLRDALTQLASASFSLELRMRTPDPAERVLHWQAEVVRDPGGRPLRVEGIVRDVTDARRAEQQVRSLAYRDGLTGVLNRNALDQHLHRSLRLAKRHGRTGAVLFLDLDGFKPVNDTFGHAAGDRILRSAAERLERCLRNTDFLARSEAPARGHVSRLGGDEFMILLTDLLCADDAGLVARRLLDSLREPFVVRRTEVVVGASIGISIFPGDGDDAEVLIRKADAAMYHAKESGRNRFEYFTESITRSASRQLALERKLCRAFESHELAVYYQPQISLATGRITGVEALLRWNDRELGAVSPSEFVPVAERAGLIATIDQWVLRTACRQAKEWRDAGLPGLRLSVNVSAHHFKSPTLVESVTQVLWDTGLEAGGLELEITESAFMEHREAAVEISRELKTSGVAIALDDFGTGYSSLSYLRHFPVDTIKIDRSFVRDLVADPEDAAITTAIISMASALRLRIVAEGVETEGQRDFLRNHGCQEMQGYLFSPPVAGDAIAELLAREPSP